MKEMQLKPAKVRQLLTAAARTRILVVGDVMLDQFIWGNVSRISPEAPVPIVDFLRESYMPGGAANVARNLSGLGMKPDLCGIIGRDDAGKRLRDLLTEQQVDCRCLLTHNERPTSIKTRVVAHQQQLVRVDRETRHDLDGPATRRLLVSLEPSLLTARAVIIGDYGKGVVTQSLIDALKHFCRQRGIWLSMDPKPVHHLNLAALSLITPNRKETFELAGIEDETRHADPLKDQNLVAAAGKLLKELEPALLLITLGEQGMLLCQRNRKLFHIPTAAQEVFDVSGAGDTVIASFTLAIAGGASPLEAAIISNHAAGVVVGKIGTATVSPEELLASFKR
jgi:D-beta-D-heptose 7-phosphate kinase/D-beta-D-heptose 1-phosphate adenosyltransferase